MLPSTDAPSEAFEPGQPPQRFFPSGAAWKLVASAMLRSLETVSMKVSSFERSRAGLSLGNGRVRVSDARRLGKVR
jgi:hypothetical protein